LLELELDFSEEDVEFAGRIELNNLIDEIINHITKLTDSFTLGNAIKNGIPVAITGNTNTGKSTLLNSLLNEERAIVSEIHGTTRDAIEETVNINGVTFRFIDTAGLRITDDTIENTGIQITYNKIKQASIILLLVDITDTALKITESINNMLKNIDQKHQQLLVVINKTDLIDDYNLNKLFSQIQLQIPEKNTIKISAKYKQNIDKLTEILFNSVVLQLLDSNETIITNSRHYEALSNSLQSLKRVKDGLATGISADFLAQDIREALYFIGSITGDITNDEILRNIFRNFCIGK
jgi:tRNA modification GTPase